MTQSVLFPHSIATGTTAVLLCADGAPEPAATLAADVNVFREPGLCEHPGRIAELAAGASAVVLALCPGRSSRRDAQTAARRAGFDALGVEFVDLRAAAGDGERLATLIAAAVARALAFEGSRPEHAKPVMPAAISRRSLLRLRLPEYVAVPAIEQELCAAGEGCQACVDVCPQDAYRWSDGHLRLDPDRCEPCGRCLTTCPTGAARNPAWTPAQLHAEVNALLRHAPDVTGPRGVVFTCRRGSPAVDTARWFPVAVPCTGMLTVNWLLAPLLMGAGAVTAYRCADVGCPLANDTRVDEALDLARTLVETLGVDPEVIRDDTDAPPSVAALPTVPLIDPYGPRGTVEVLLALTDVVEPPGHVRITHPAASLGEVTISADACTLCGSCSTSCPTDALRWKQHHGHTVLTFDAARCTACAQCLLRCPERDAGAIELERVLDLPALQAGPTTLLRDDTVACVKCGRPFASRRFVAHVARLLADEHASVLDIATRYCLDCRGAPIPARPSA